MRGLLFAMAGITILILTGCNSRRTSPPRTEAPPETPRQVPAGTEANIAEPAVHHCIYVYDASGRAFEAMV